MDKMKKQLKKSGIALFVLISTVSPFVVPNLIASSGTERYTEKYFKIEDRWKLKYTNGLEFRLYKPNPQELAISWVEKSSPDWAKPGPLTINPLDFSTINTRPFNDFIEQEYKARSDTYNQKKHTWYVAEKKRYMTQLAQWKVKKKAYEKSESAKYSIALDKWSKDKAVYEQEKKQRLLEWEEAQKKKKLEFKENLKIWQEKKGKYDTEETTRFLKEKQELEKKRDKDLAELLAEYQDNRAVQKILRQVTNKEKQCQSAEEKKKCLDDLAFLKIKHKNRNNSYYEFYYKRLGVIRAFNKNLNEIRPVAFEKSSGLFSNRKKPIERNYKIEKPTIKVFRAKPKKFRDFKEIKPVPQKPRPFTEKPPRKDTTRGYDIGGLILRLGKTNCSEEAFQLRKGYSHYFAHSKRSKEIGHSNWSGNDRRLNLRKCQIVGRGRFSGIRLMQILYHENRPLSISIGQTTYQLLKIESPSLIEFEAGITDKEYYLRDLLEFITGNSRTNKKESVEARYITTEDSKTRYLDIVYSANKKNIVKLEFKTYQYLFDSRATSKDIVVYRVAYLQDGMFGEIINPFLRRHYWFYEGGSSKKWQLLAKYKYGLLDDNSLGNQIILMEKKANGGVESSKISATGLLSDFTSLMFLPAWCKSQNRDRMNLGYFDDSRVFGSVLIKQPDTEWLNFEEFEGFYNRIKVSRWILQSTSDGSTLFEFLVGDENHIIYRMVSGDKQIELAKIRTQTINDSIAWYKKILAVNDFLRITN